MVGIWSHKEIILLVSTQKMLGVLFSYNEHFTPIPLPPKIEENLTYIAGAHENLSS